MYVIGYSKGGVEVDYVVLEWNFYVIIWVVLNFYCLLSFEVKKWVDRGEMENKVMDYIYENDLIGNYI